MIIDPGVITFIQSAFLQRLSAAVPIVINYALNLLYIFVTLEVIFFGLGFALQQDATWRQAFFKVIKIGLIFFVIQNYPILMDDIIKSFAQIGGIIAHSSNTDRFIFNPAILWQYGYDIGITLLKSAALSSALGLIIIQVILGFGIILFFGLLGIQIILQILGFYVVSLTALIFLPFGTFNVTSKLFDNAVQLVLKAGVKVMTLIMVVSIAIITWHSFNLIHMPKPYHLNALLGLFFSSLLFLYLAIRLPKIAAETVGQIGSHSYKTIVPPASQATYNTNVQPAASAGLPSMQAATMITPSQPISQSAAASQISSISAASSATSISSDISPFSSKLVFSRSIQADTYSKNNLESTDTLDKSISKETLKKIKKTFLEALEEKEKQEKDKNKKTEGNIS